jgi:hypothetical protein
MSIRDRFCFLLSATGGGCDLPGAESHLLAGRLVCGLCAALALFCRPVISPSGLGAALCMVRNSADPRPVQCKECQCRVLRAVHDQLPKIGWPRAVVKTSTALSPDSQRKFRPTKTVRCDFRAIFARGSGNWFCCAAASVLSAVSLGCIRHVIRNGVTARCDR